MVRLLEKNPDKRITLEEAMKNKWVTNGGSLPDIKSSSNLEVDHINVSEEERTAAVTPSIERVFDSLPDMEERVYNVGEYIVRRGHPTEGLFLIKVCSIPFQHLLELKCSPWSMLDQLNRSCFLACLIVPYGWVNGLLDVNGTCNIVFPRYHFCLNRLAHKCRRCSLVSCVMKLIGAWNYVINIFHNNYIHEVMCLIGGHV